MVCQSGALIAPVGKARTMTSFLVNTASALPRSLATGETGIVDTTGSLLTTGTAITVLGAADLYNLGIIRNTTATADASTIVVRGSGALIDNRGSIRAGTAAGADAIEFSATNRPSTNLDIINSGTIRATADGGSAIRLSTGGTEITNTGTIAGTGEHGIHVRDLNGGTLGTRITNSGVIEGGRFAREFAILIENNDPDRIENSGQILSDVDTGGGNDVVINSGFIDGNLITGDGDDMIVNTGNIGFTQSSGFESYLTIFLGNGNDTIDNRNATTETFVAGGAGDDVYLVGANIRVNVVEETPNGDFGGNDRVESFMSFILQGQANNVETLILLGTAVHGTGGSIANTINGNGMNNFLAGQGGNDTLSGASGDDTLDGGEGADLLLGGVGLRDVAAYSLSFGEGLRADLAFAGRNTCHAAGDVYLGIEDLRGSTFNDLLAGDTGGNILEGSFGNDSLFGREGNDTLIGSAGNDLLVGGTDNDVLQGGIGADQMNGEGGLRDAASYVGATAGLRADLAFAVTNTGDAAGDTYTAVEDLIGTSLNDVLAGDTANNLVRGEDGNDAVFGRDGNDTVQGGQGADSIFGGAGNDLLSGGAGPDSFFFNGAVGSDNIETVQDFVAADDQLGLEDAIFVGLATGTLTANAFALGTAAQQTDDRIIYNAANGQILFDADGTGAGAAVHFATLAAGTTLTAADFFVF